MWNRPCGWFADLPAAASAIVGVGGGKAGRGEVRGLSGPVALPCGPHLAVQRRLLQPAGKPDDSRQRRSLKAALPYGVVVDVGVCLAVPAHPRRFPELAIWSPTSTTGRERPRRRSLEADSAHCRPHHGRDTRRRPMGPYQRQGMNETMAFLTLGTMQLTVAIALRARPRTWANPFLLVAAGSAWLLQLSAVYVPPLAELLGTQPLPLRDLAVVTGVSLLGYAGIRLDRKLHPR